MTYHTGFLHNFRILSHHLHCPHLLLRYQSRSCLIRFASYNPHIMLNMMFAWNRAFPDVSFGLKTLLMYISVVSPSLFFLFWTYIPVAGKARLVRSGSQHVDIYDYTTTPTTSNIIHTNFWQIDIIDCRRQEP